MFNKPLPRRTFLKGAGTVLALPWLEAMLPRGAAAQAAQAAKPPTRMLFLFIPNGVHMQDWTPKGEEGALTELPWILEPLEPLREELLVLTGLTHDKARPNGDGPGDHARSSAAFLTASQPVKTHGTDIRVGISVDQYAAQQIGEATRFPSLELGIEGGRQAGNCDSGYSCAYSSNIAWRTETAPVPKEVNPRLVFDRLFGSGDPAAQSAARQRRDQYRKSILDFVLDDVNALNRDLGARDQRKLDEYLTSVREIERRLELANQAEDGNAPDGTKRPDGVPRSYADHTRLMLDMLALAVETDATRIATFMFANEGSNRNYRQIGIDEGHHYLSHHGGDAEKHDKIRRINRFHLEQFVYFIQKLKATPEAGGSLLDHCMVVYGSGISDGDRHNHDNLPVLLAGKGNGTLRPGRHLRYRRNTPMANLYVSMLERVGVHTEQFGDSNGRLTGLL